MQGASGFSDAAPLEAKSPDKSFNYCTCCARRRAEKEEAKRLVTRSADDGLVLNGSFFSSCFQGFSFDELTTHTLFFFSGTHYHPNDFVFLTPLLSTRSTPNPFRLGQIRSIKWGTGTSFVDVELSLILRQEHLSSTSDNRLVVPTDVTFHLNRRSAGQDLQGHFRLRHLQQVLRVGEREEISRERYCRDPSAFYFSQVLARVNPGLLGRFAKDVSEIPDPDIPDSLKLDLKNLIRQADASSVQHCTKCDQRQLDLEKRMDRVGILRKDFREQLTLTGIEVSAFGFQCHLITECLFSIWQTYAGVGGLGMGLEMGW